MCPQASPADPQGRYARTPSGQAEIRGRAHALTRPMRNLLLVIHPGQTAEAWLAQVQGAGWQDLATLMALGLIEPVADVKPAAGRAPRPQSESPVDWATAEAAIERASYRTLYELLTDQVSHRAGLFRGYRGVLRIERTSGVEEIRALAIEMARGWHHEGGARWTAFARALLKAADPSA